MSNFIPAVLEKTAFEALEEPVKGYFTEKDGKYYPNFRQEDVEKLAIGLRRNRDDILSEKNTIEAELREYRKFGKPEEIQTKLTEKLSGDPEDVQKLKQKHAEELESLKERFKLESEKGKTEFQTRESFLLDEIYKGLTGSEIATAVAEHHGNPKLLEPIIRGAVKVVETKTADGTAKFDIQVLDKDGKPRYADALGTPFKVADYVAELRADTTNYGGAFYAGSEGGTGGFNSQKQNFSGSKVIKRAEFNNLPHPERAAKMKDGYTIQD